jgi:dTDP-4-dehydrorhamnose 3,5-epimerase
MGQSVKINQTTLPGVLVIESMPLIDNRGFFSRLYCEKEFGTFLEKRQIVQVNHSCTRTVGAVRGMHYQVPPHAEMKFVRCLKGRVWDVVVDLREHSPTFLQWHAQEISPQNSRMLIIPEGCAHGFQVLELNSEILYLHTNFYAPEYEAGIPYNDPTLNITWPIPITDISARDISHLAIRPDFKGIAA